MNVHEGILFCWLCMLIILFLKANWLKKLHFLRLNFKDHDNKAYSKKLGKLKLLILKGCGISNSCSYPKTDHLRLNVRAF